VGQLGSFDPWGRKTRAGFHARRRDRGLRIAKFSACAIPVDRETKNHLTIDPLSPRLIALLARSADGLPTSLTAGKNVVGFAQSAPLSVVQAWWILRIVGRKGRGASAQQPQKNRLREVRSGRAEHGSCACREP
jgi:hypothetical protein